uniref:signal-transducing adaptor protein 1-like n=1 Tax=Monopterus albus TaxID=43700 RepID=UPI0009B31382|nr:signal-transducing adaptor protein 1-like [Monopterus albus]
MHPRVLHKKRATITELPLYYSGHLLKKNSKEKDFKKYHGELRGATLFLYKDDTQDTYTERLDLEQLKSMEMESPYQRKVPTIFTLTLQTEEVHLKMDNADTGEEWRGYILTVVKKEMPSKLHLLPGQLFQLQEVLAQERGRIAPLLPPRPSVPFQASPSSSPPDCSSLDMPECFFNVTREEAKQMLNANPEYGNIILRPSTLANNYAVTLRQLMSSGPVMKNYRVTSTNSGFVIELEKPVKVTSLNHVLKYFLEQTECVKCISPTPLPKAQVAPMLRSQPKEVFLPPLAKPEEGEYVDPDDHTLKLGEKDLSR